jgi:hypothetical protein
MTFPQSLALAASLDTAEAKVTDPRGQLVADERSNFGTTRP